MRPAGEGHRGGTEPDRIDSGIAVSPLILKGRCLTAVRSRCGYCSSLWRAVCWPRLYTGCSTGSTGGETPPVTQWPSTVPTHPSGLTGRRPSRRSTAPSVRRASSRRGRRRCPPLPPPPRRPNLCPLGPLLWHRRPERTTTSAGRLRLSRRLGRSLRCRERTSAVPSVGTVGSCRRAGDAQECRVRRRRAPLASLRGYPLFPP